MFYFSICDYTSSWIDFEMEMKRKQKTEDAKLHQITQKTCLIMTIELNKRIKYIYVCILLPYYLLSELFQILIIIFFYFLRIQNMNLELEAFLNIMRLRENMVFKPRTIKLKAPLFTPSYFEQLHPQLKKVYLQIFKDDNCFAEISLKDILPFIMKSTEKPMCNKTITKKDEVYRCFDCAVHQDAIFCKSCFQESDHKGHRYKKTSCVGKCDCGNTQILKKQGFCAHHSGIIKENEKIQQAQFQQFFFYFLEFFKWYFQLKKTQKENSEVFGCMILKYLFDLNQNSMFYNKLTYQLLFKEIDGERIIRRLFQIHSPIHGPLLSSIILEIMALKEAKLQIMKEYIYGYNNFEGFEHSSFKSLFIQIFSNKQTLMTLLDTSDEFLDPQNRYYDQMIYYENLYYILCLQVGLAQKYLKKMLQKKKFIKAKYMQEIEKQFENGKRHIIEAIDKYLNIDNMYLLISEKVYEIMEDSPTVMQSILQSLVQRIKSGKESYVVNKMMMPYHRSFILGLFAQAEHKNMPISASFLLQTLNTQQKQTLQILEQLLKNSLNCLFQFSKTYSGRSYFDNYVPLYVRGGQKLIKYDFYLIRTIFNLLREFNKIDNFSNIIIKLLEQKRSALQKKEHQFGNSEQLEQYHITVNFFMGLLLENILEDKQTLILAMDISSFPMKEKKMLEKIRPTVKNFLIKFANSISQFNYEELKIFSKHFLGLKFDESIIEQICQFNQQTKKFKLNKDVISNEIINIHYNVSLIKAHQYFTNLDGKSKLTNYQLTNEQKQRIQIFLSTNLIKYFIQSQRKLNKSQKIMNGIIIQCSKYYALASIKKPEFKNILFELYQQNTKLFQCELLKPIKDQLNISKQSVLKESQEQQESAKKAMIEKMKANKMKQLREKMKKAKTMFVDNQNLQKNPEKHSEQEDPDCLICHEKCPDKMMSYLGRVGLSNQLNHQYNIGKEHLTLRSCCHSIHIECAKQLLKSIYFYCPLCKTLSNILVPINITKAKALKDITDILHRFCTIKDILKKRINAPLKQVVQKQKTTIQQILFEIILGLIDICFMQSKNITKYGARQFKFHKSLFKTVTLCYQILTKEKQKELTNFLVQTKAEYFTNKNQLTDIYDILTEFFFTLKFQSEVQSTLLKKIEKNSSLQIAACLASFNTGYKLIENKKHEEQNKQTIHIPQTVTQLFNMRDQSYSLCKKGHQICLCIQCGYQGCLDCQQIQQHIFKNHCGRGVFINLQKGILIYKFRSHTVIGLSIYQNSYGKKWKICSDTSNEAKNEFKLDKKQLCKVRSMLLQGELQDFMSKQFTSGHFSVQGNLTATISQNI